MKVIPFFTLLQWRAAIKLEAAGMKHSSRRSVTAHAKRLMGIKGDRTKVLAAVNEAIKTIKDKMKEGVQHDPS